MAPKLKHLGHQSSQIKTQAGITIEELKALTAARLASAGCESFNRSESDGLRISNPNVFASNMRNLHRIDQHAITVAELKKMTKMRLERDDTKPKNYENKSGATDGANGNLLFDCHQHFPHELRMATPDTVTCSHYDGMGAYVDQHSCFSPHLQEPAVRQQQHQHHINSSIISSLDPLVHSPVYAERTQTQQSYTNQLNSESNNDFDVFGFTKNSQQEQPQQPLFKLSSNPFDFGLNRSPPISPKLCVSRKKSMYLTESLLQALSSDKSAREGDSNVSSLDMNLCDLSISSWDK